MLLRKIRMGSMIMRRVIFFIGSETEELREGSSTEPRFKIEVENEKTAIKAPDYIFCPKSG